MTEKALRKLSRVELLEMLIAQSTELQACKEKLAAAEAALQNREIAVNKAGSIADAALMLNGVFDAAQLACQQYTENIRLLNERQEAVCAKMEEESRVKAERILADAERERAIMERSTKAQCDEMISRARMESQKYWEDVSDKLEAFYAEHIGLRELLSVVTQTNNGKLI